MQEEKYFSDCIVALALMLFSINIPGTNTMIDLRFFPLIFVFYYAGFIPLITASLFTILYRIIFFGLSFASITASITIMLLMGVIYIINLTIKKEQVRIYAYYIAFILLFSITLYIQIGKYNHFFEIIFTYFGISLGTYILMFYLIKYVDTSNYLFRKYKEDSTKDFLTGLYNTRQFDYLFNNISTNIVEQNSQLSILMIDIDFFKRVNDTYGHNAGDFIISDLAKVLRMNCSNTDLISRIGGEEFVIISIGSSVNEAKILAEKLRNVVENYDFVISDDEKISITISIGLSSYPQSTNDINKLKELSDSALYLSKQNGRNQVSIL